MQRTDTGPSAPVRHTGSVPKWPRLRKGDKRGDENPAASPTRPRPKIDASAVSGVRGASWDRPPSAEELKAAFQKRRRVEPEEAPPPKKKSEFEELFSHESLYVGADASAEPEQEPDERPEQLYDPVDPWSVLHVERTALWPDVVAAHRRLALRYHPDRLLDATDAEKEQAADRIREINIAYSTIKRRMGR